MAGQSNVERTLGILLGKIEGIEDRLERADDSRAAVHRRLDDLVLRTTHLESDTAGLTRKVDDMQKVTDDVVQLRAKATGAGALGRWLIRVGIGVVTLAGWIVGAYAWFTGRPPP